MRYSVIVPLHNEEDSVTPLYDALGRVMNYLALTYEIIFVDDGSTDRSLEKLRFISLHSSSVVVVSLKRRRGIASALQAGFDRAKGEVIITLDCDLQNDPGDIPFLIRKLSEGFDVVCGWRHERKDPASKIFASRIANHVRSITTQEELHDVGCTLRVFKREVLKKIRLSGGLHRFFTTIVRKRGFKIAEVKVRHHTRKFGRSKFGFFGSFVRECGHLATISFTDLEKLMDRDPDYEIKEIIAR